MKNVIRGRVAYAGMDMPELSRKTGLCYSTLCKRAVTPDQLRLWELSKISNAVGGLTLEDLAELGILVRGRT